MIDFGEWLGKQAKASAAGIAQCLSRTDLVKTRAGFGQVIRPAPGSVLAAPSVEDRVGEPDYFFHWIRDAALVMRAIPDLVRTGDSSADWPQYFRDWVRFELSLADLDGRVAIDDWPARVAPEFRQFVRDPAELAAIHGDTVAGDVRVNADGTLDRIRWSRPQHDGPALRLLTCRRGLGAGLTADGIEDLMAADLAYTRKYAGQISVDLWEEHAAEHYYTILVQAAALDTGDAADRDLATSLLDRLDQFWSADEGFIRCTMPREMRKSLDIAVILGVLHAGRETGRHSIADPRVQATLSTIERRFGAYYPINRGRRAGAVLGRYPGDHYGTKGPWYIATFAAAEFRYRMAAQGGEPIDTMTEADAILAAAQRTIPNDGQLSEQFDPATGAQSSARDLAWSHAAFLSAAMARRMVE
jgi:glucoamylase